VLFACWILLTPRNFLHIFCNLLSLLNWQYLQQQKMFIWNNGIFIVSLKLDINWRVLWRCCSRKMQAFLGYCLSESNNYHICKLSCNTIWINNSFAYFLYWICTRVYQKVSGLAARSKNCKWYSSLILGAVVSLFWESV